MQAAVHNNNTVGYIISVYPSKTLLLQYMQLTKLILNRKRIISEKHRHFYSVQENAQAYNIIAAKILLSLMRGNQKDLISYLGYIFFH